MLTREQLQKRLSEIEFAKDVFAERYKGRVLEVARRGNKKRPWYATVDGVSASVSCQTTSTFASPSTAMARAKNMVDSQIAVLSNLRNADPERAVDFCRHAVNSVESSLVRPYPLPERTEFYMRNILQRVREDLRLAEAALKKKQENMI